MAMAKGAFSIAGGGLSGLSAAITLARAGRKVSVYEKGPACGARRQGDIEGLETWIFDEDPLSYMAAAGLPTQFAHLPQHSFNYVAPDGGLQTAKEERPFFYLVQRGAEETSIDQAFYRQAVELGVQFHFKEAKKPGEVDLFAGGPKAANAYAHGITFRTTAPDGVYLLLGREAAPSGYAYGIVWNGQGTLAAAFRRSSDGADWTLERLVERFSKVLGGPLTEKAEFAAYGHYAPKPNLFSGQTLLAGEAAGWQDALFGFGMNFAIRSGVIAARSLLDQDNYAALCKVELTGRLAASWVNRSIYERLSDRAMAKLAHKLIERGAVWSTLHAAAQPSFIKGLMARLAA